MDPEAEGGGGGWLVNCVVIVGSRRVRKVGGGKGTRIVDWRVSVESNGPAIFFYIFSLRFCLLNLFLGGCFPFSCAPKSF